MLKIFFNTAISLPLLLISSIASASLITNGSFEELTVTNKSTINGFIQKHKFKNFAKKESAWDVFYTLPGWVTTAGKGIELQKNIVSNSAEGSHHIELDSKGHSSNSVMTQTIDSLIIGQEYLLEFAYKPRSDRENDNGINVFWYDTAVNFDLDMTANFAVNETNKTSPDWQIKSIQLVAQAESMDLSFGAFGHQNTYGGLLDNISLVQVNNASATDIPEPSTLALSLLGFVALVRLQKKNK